MIECIEKMLHKKLAKLRFRVCRSGEPGYSFYGKPGLCDSLEKYRNCYKVRFWFLLRNPKSFSMQEVWIWFHIRYSLRCEELCPLCCCAQAGPGAESPAPACAHRRRARAPLLLRSGWRPKEMKGSAVGCDVSLRLKFVVRVVVEGLPALM